MCKTIRAHPCHFFLLATRFLHDGVLCSADLKVPDRVRQGGHGRIASPHGIHHRDGTDWTGVVHTSRCGWPASTSLERIVAFTGMDMNCTMGRCRLQVEGFCWWCICCALSHRDWQREEGRQLPNFPLTGGLTDFQLHHSSPPSSSTLLWGQRHTDTNKSDRQ